MKWKGALEKSELKPECCEQSLHTWIFSDKNTGRWHDGGTRSKGATAKRKHMHTARSLSFEGPLRERKRQRDMDGKMRECQCWIKGNSRTIHVSVLDLRSWICRKGSSRNTNPNLLCASLEDIVLSTFSGRFSCKKLITQTTQMQQKLC